MSDNRPKKGPEREISDPRLRKQELEVAPLLRTTQIVIWLGLGLLLLALAWWGIGRRLTWAPVIIGGLGVLGVAFWLALNLPALRRAAGTRSAKMVLNSVGFIIFVAGILVCINVIVARHHPKLDLTKGRIYTLASQTRDFLKGLPADVELVAFLPQGDVYSANARELVKLYSAASPRVRVTWADYTNVTLAKKYDVKYPGTVVVQAGDKQEKITEVTEQHLTSAIMSVTTEEKLAVYFLTNHGEASISGGDNGISQIKNDLANQQYEVKELELAKMQEPAVPEDCSVLAIIGAQIQPAPQEMAAIEKYLENHGKLLIALAAPPAPDFASLLSSRGVTPLAGIVIDPQSSFMGDATAPMVAPEASGSPVLEGVDQLVLPICRALEVAGGTPPPTMPGQPPPQGPATALVSSSAASWLQPNLSAGTKEPENAQKGPFAMAASIDESPPPPPQMPGQPPAQVPETDATRIVVLGSSTALNDNLVRLFRFNANVALNSIAWLSRNTRMVSIPPKTEEMHQLLLTNTQKNFIIFVVMFFIPLAVIIAGTLVWWTRRR